MHEDESESNHNHNLCCFFPTRSKDNDSRQLKTPTESKIRTRVIFVGSDFIWDTQFFGFFLFSFVFLLWLVILFQTNFLFMAHVCAPFAVAHFSPVIPIDPELLTSFLPSLQGIRCIRFFLFFPLFIPPLCLLLGLPQA